MKKESLAKLQNQFPKINKDIYQGGLSDSDVLFLSKLASKIRTDKPQVVEVGSWTGCSTFVLADAVKDKGGKVFAVDHWKGNEGTLQEKTVKRYDVFSLFKSNMRRFGVWGIITPIQQDSLTAVKSFEDNSLDLVFIDADHRYDYFMADIKAWLPKVKVKGILCGHDAEVMYSYCTIPQKMGIDNSLNEDVIPNIIPKIHAGVIKGLYDYFKDMHYLGGLRIWYYKKLT